MTNNKLTNPLVFILSLFSFAFFLFTLVQVIDRYSVGDKDASFAWSVISLGILLIVLEILQRKLNYYKSAILWLSISTVFYAYAAIYKVEYLIIFSSIGIVGLIYLSDKRKECPENPTLAQVIWPATAPILVGLIIAASYYMVTSMPYRSDGHTIEEWSESDTKEVPAHFTYDELFEFARSQDDLYGSTGDVKFRKSAFKAYEAAYEVKINSFEPGEDEFSDKETLRLMITISERYYNGVGVEQSYSDAHYFYSKLAWSNDDEIASRYSKKLADMWANGTGVEKDIEMALQYYSFDEVPHYFEIAEMYRKNNDYSNALIHYSKIPDDPRANYWLGEFSFSGLGHSGFDDRLDIDYRDAFQYMDSAARKGHKLAQAKLAEYYLLGIGIEKDIARASNWISEASSNDEAIDYVNYVRGLTYLAAPENSVGYDKSKAIQLLESASNNGVIEATLRLVKLYAFDPDSDDQLLAGRNTLQEKANEGNPRASYLVGLLYKSGRGFEQSYQEAFELIQYAARNGIPEAAREMSDFYKNGYYVERSQLRSDRWNAYWRANR